MSLTSSLIFGLPSEAVLASCAAIVTALLGWLGGRGIGAAALSNSVTERLRLLMSASQSEIARLTARDSETEKKLEERDQRIDLLEDMLGDARRDLQEARRQLSGDMANLQQVQESTLRLQEKDRKSPIPDNSLLRRYNEDGGTDV